MPFKVDRVSELKGGSFCFAVMFWSSIEDMRADAKPDWRNEFVTNLSSVVGRNLRRTRFQHDAITKSSSMQRADTLEWIPVDAWHGDGGLTTRGIEPTYEFFTPDIVFVRRTLRTIVNRFDARRHRANRVNATWASSPDYRQSRAKDELGSTANLHPDLQAQLGIVEESL